MIVKENISLKAYNTFGLDVRVRRLVMLEEDDRVDELWSVVDGQWIVLGGGSNMVFTRDYEGTIVTLSRTQHSTFDNQQSTVTAWGGMEMDELVRSSLEHGMYGLENLSAIPGTVGASAVQNVGAYGAEAKDFIEKVEAYDLVERRHCCFSNAECRFAYRDSLFKHHPGRYLILHVTYRLRRESVPNLSYKALEGLPHGTAEELRKAITDLRWSKLPRPEEHGSAGSFFKNPVVDEATYLRLKAGYPDMPDAHPAFNIQHSTLEYKLSAGWLIDRAGWKGRTMGRAGVWPKNALVLYNTGGCTGNEVVALADAIVSDVRSKFGITLTPEAIII